MSFLHKVRDVLPSNTAPASDGNARPGEPGKLDQSVELVQVGENCLGVRSEFSAYLDGAVSGHRMAQLAGHFQNCAACAREFEAWRSVGTALATLGPARAPENLQSRLRSIAAAEREQGTHLSLNRRLALLWGSTLGPLALRTAGGAAFAGFLFGCLGWIFGPAMAVQANDDSMAHFVAPRYLYSQVTPQPIQTSHEVPILVDAKVDSRGRVYDFTILAGPQNAVIETRLEENLLASVFKPASLFGEPVNGHVMLTFMGVSVKP